MTRSGFSVVQPLKRDDVVTRMVKDDAVAVTEAINLFNARMGGAKELPQRFDENEFGATVVIRTKVIELIKAAGWRVDRCDGVEEGNRGGDPYYEVS